MGDNRTHSADSRAHCVSIPADTLKSLLCTGDPMSGMDSPSCRELDNVTVPLRGLRVSVSTPLT
jgi:hypothetical protein